MSRGGSTTLYVTVRPNLLALSLGPSSTRHHIDFLIPLDLNMANTKQGFGPGTRARDLAYEFERYVNQTSISR